MFFEISCLRYKIVCYYGGYQLLWLVLLSVVYAFVCCDYWQWTTLVFFLFGCIHGWIGLLLFAWWVHADFFMSQTSSISESSIPDHPTLDFFFPQLIPTMPFPHSDLFLSDFMHFKPLNYFQTNWGFKYKVWEASWSNLSLQSLFSLCKWQGCITVISSVMFSMVRQVWLSHLIAHFTIYCSLNDTHLVAPIYPPTYTSVCHSSTNIIHRTSASLYCIL